MKKIKSKTNIFTRTINKIKHVFDKLHVKHLRKNCDILSEVILDDLKEISDLQPNLFTVDPTGKLRLLEKKKRSYIYSIDVGHPTYSRTPQSLADRIKTVLSTMQKEETWKGRVDYDLINPNEIKNIIDRLTEYVAAKDPLDDRYGISYGKPFIKINTAVGIYIVTFNSTTNLLDYKISDYHCVKNTYFESLIEIVRGTFSAEGWSMKQEWDMAMKKYIHALIQNISTLVTDTKAQMTTSQLVGYLDTAFTSLPVNEVSGAKVDDNVMVYLFNTVIIEHCKNDPESSRNIIKSDDIIRPMLMSSNWEIIYKYLEYKMTADKIVEELKVFNITKYRLSKLFPRNEYDAWVSAKRDPVYGPPHFRKLGDIFLDEYDDYDVLVRVTKPKYAIAARYTEHDETELITLDNFLDIISKNERLCKCPGSGDLDTRIWAFGYICSKLEVV